MPKTSRLSIQCQNCRQPIAANVQNIVDAKQDPDAKVRLISGRLNAVPCPNCGALNTVMTPMLYHDPAKELLITFVPMQVGLKNDDMERVVGDLVRELMNSLPPEQRKGYLFNPKRALTMQGLVDQVLEADGITPEVMAEQKARVDLIQQFLQTPPDLLPDVVKQNDAKIDARFMQTMSVMAQRMMQDGQPQIAEHILAVQGALVELSSYGQEVARRQEVQEAVVQEVAGEINAIGPQATRADFLNLAVRYADSEEHLQALVGLIRPAFDYQFFQEMTEFIGKAPAADREPLEALREHLTELTAAVDRQSQAVLQQAVALLQAIVNAENPDELIRANLPLVDDTFLAVLTANIEEADRRRDIASSGRLKAVYNRVISILQENMQPELRFVNQLLSLESDEEAQKMIADHAADYGPELLDVMDAVGQVLAQRGDKETVEKLVFLRTAAEKVLS
ncbi:MAG: CpXC domain-containing protein [Anaerolineae bacterium]